MIDQFPPTRLREHGIRGIASAPLGEDDGYEMGAHDPAAFAADDSPNGGRFGRTPANVALVTIVTPQPGAKRRLNERVG